MKTNGNQVVDEEYAKTITLVTEDGKQFVKKEFYQHKNMDIYLKLMNNPHHNIGEVFKVVEYDDHFEVYEAYLGNITLNELAPTKYQEEAYDIILELCDAIKHIHNLGIVHRDIKPENIYYYNHTVYLNDFDISKPVYKKRVINKDTELLGTEGYASPEQYGFSASDERTDIYSLGIVINELFTGEHIQDKLIDGKLREVVLKCTEMNADDRYQNMDELIVAIKQAKAGKSKLTLPGFRTDTLRNKIIACIGYFMILVIIITAEAEGGISWKDHLEAKILMAMMSIYTLVIVTNYMEVRNVLPKSLKDRKIFGTVTLWFSGVFALVLIYALIKTLFQGML